MVIMNKLFIISILNILIGNILLAQIPHVSSGQIIRIDSFPSQYVKPHKVDIWLPDGYTNKQKYAVLYLQDGEMLFDSTITWNKQEWGLDETMGRLNKEKKLRNCIIVAIWNGGPLRSVEYFPERPFDLLNTEQKEKVLKAARKNDEYIGIDRPQSDNYLRFIVKELKPFIDKKFSTIRKPSGTFIGGASYGGLISLYAVCEYPKVFGGAICMSTHWLGPIFSNDNNPVPGAIMQYLEHHLPDPKTHRFYFDHGTATLDALYPDLQKQADAIMMRHFYTPGHWMTRVFYGEDHSEKAWGRRMEVPLQFLLSPR